MDIVMIFKSSRVICCHNDLDGYFDEDGDNISPQVDLMEGLQLDRDPWGRRRSSRWQIFSLCLFSNLLFTIFQSTRPSVNYAKNWLGQLFLFPGLV